MVSILNPAGNALVESTYLGGTGTDYGVKDIAVNTQGNVWVTGQTYSAWPQLNSPGKACNTSYGSIYITEFAGFGRPQHDHRQHVYGRATSGYYAWGNQIIPGPGQYSAREAGGVYPSASGSWPIVPAGAPIFGGGGIYDGQTVSINFGGASVSFGPVMVTPLPATHDLNCVTAGDYVIIGLSFTNTGLSPQPDNPGPEFTGTLVGPSGGVLEAHGQQRHVHIAGNSLEWNGRHPVRRHRDDQRQDAHRGRRAGRRGSVCIQGTVYFDTDDNGTNDAQRSTNACATTNCPPTVDPNSQADKEVHLPILNFQGQDDVCRTWIEVQVVGPEFSKAVLVTWGEPGFCPPQCAGPLKVECTGLLKPGSTWNFLGAQIPTGSKSGMLFKFTTKQLSDVAPDLVPPDDIVADYMCETLFFGVVGDCDDYRRFKKAYIEGLEFAGLSMGDGLGRGLPGGGRAAGLPGRRDAGRGGDDRSTTASRAATWAPLDPVYGGYQFYVPLLYADKAGFNSIMYIQNGGLECSSIEMWFKAQDDCLRARICEVLTLAPGETYQFDASDCVGPDWQGSAWIRSTQPLGIVVDIIGRDVLMTYMGEPGELSYYVDPIDPNKPAFTPGQPGGVRAADVQRVPGLGHGRAGAEPEPRW